MARKQIPEWLVRHFADGGSLFDTAPGESAAHQGARESGVVGMSDQGAPTTLGSTDLNRFTSFFVGQDPFRTTTPIVNLKQTPSTYERQNFYGDVGTERGRISDIYGQQQGLAAQLAARARGEGQSLAEMQLQRTLEENQRRAQGAIGSIRGMNPALAQRLLLNQQAAMSQQAAGQGAQLRAAEQLEAQKALGSLLGGMRGAEGQGYGQAGELGLGQEKLGVSTQEAQKERQLKTALANQQADLDRQKYEIEARKVADATSLPGMLGSVGQLAGGLGQGAGAAYSSGLIGSGGGAAGGAAALAAAYDGGKVPDDLSYADGGKMPKAKIMKAHEAARKILESAEFRKRYGDRAKNVAYAIGMKNVQKKADGGEMHLAKLDNKKNDTIPAMLSEGEAVIPRSIMASKNAPEKAALFLKALAKKKSPKEAKKMALGGKMHMDKMKEMEMRIKQLEAALGK